MTLHSTALIHQLQPTQQTCVCTSIAMILGVPAEEVIASYHEAYYVERISTGELLRRVGLPFESFISADDKYPDKPGYYLLGVPSLQIPGGMHQIVANAYYNSAKELVWEIYDPQAGNPNCRYYTAVADPEDPLQHSLAGGYVVCAVISHNWRDLTTSAPPPAGS